MIGAIEKAALAVALIELISDEVGGIGEPGGAPNEAAAIGAIVNLLDAYYRGLAPKARGDA